MFEGHRDQEPRKEVPPPVIINNHNEAFPVWLEAGIKGGTLVHVDAHPDMNGTAVYVPPEKLHDHYEKKLTIANFIVPALHYGLVKNIIWLNPHSTDRNLQLLVHRNNVQTHVREGGMKDGKFWIDWDPLEVHMIASGRGIVATPDRIKPFLEGPIILDVDLDAFSCNTKAGPYHVDDDYQGEEGWEGRVDQFTSFLQETGLKPSVITVARSQGEQSGGGPNWIPADKVDAVQASVLQKMNDIFHRT